MQRLRFTTQRVELIWNMKEGNKHGFAVELGRYLFKATRPARVINSNANANGIVIADSVAFVKIKAEQRKLTE